MLELLSALSAFAGLLALISPQTPIGKKFFNKIGIKNELLEKHHKTYHQYLGIFILIIAVLFLTSVIIYFDYTKFVGIFVFAIPVFGFLSLVFLFGKLSEFLNKRKSFLTFIGYAPLKVTVAAIVLGFLLLITAPPIFQSKEITFLYEKLKQEKIPLHTLIENQEKTKTEFQAEFEKIVTLTQKSHLLQDFERYYQEGIEYSCHPKPRNTNHSRVEQDFFNYLCTNFDEEFRNIYIPQIKNSWMKKRGGIAPEVYPVNWLNKLVEKQASRVSQLILNIRMILGGILLAIITYSQSLTNVILGIVIITICYFLAYQLHKYNNKYDADAGGKTFIFYAIFTFISFFTFVWSSLIKKKHTREKSELAT